MRQEAEASGRRKLQCLVRSVATPVTGLVRGKTVTLDSAVPDLEGQRVRVTLEPVEEVDALPPQAQDSLWKEWVERGPQGPIEPDADVEFP